MDKIDSNPLISLVLTAIALLYFSLHLFPAIKAIPGIPNEKIIVPIWLLLLVLLKTNILFCREFSIVLIFLLVHLLYLVINNYALLNPRTTDTQGNIFLAVFFCISFFLYSKIETNERFNTLIFWAVTLSIVITGGATIIAALKNPLAVRSMIGNGDSEAVRNLLSQNVGGYSFQYMVALISPLFLYAVKQTNNKMWYLPFVIGTLSVLFAQVVGIIIIHILNTFSVFIILKTKSLKILLSRLALVAIILMFSKRALGLLLVWLAEILYSFEQIHNKFLELASLLIDDGSVDSNTDNNEDYAERLAESVNAFYDSPFVGGNPAGGHHFWMDNFAEHGLLGTLPWLFLLISFNKYISIVFDKMEALLILGITLMFVIFGLSKNILIFKMPLYLFFIAPIVILYFKNKNQQNETQN